MESSKIAAVIDQTLLKPTIGMREAAEWMEANRDMGFAALCVSPFLVPLASQRLAGTGTKVCSVVGFPLGYALTETKVEESAHLVELGCHEIDMVMNFAQLLEGEHDYVAYDIQAVAEMVGERSSGTAILKVILETGHLSESDIEEACRICVEAGADFVKTSTGFGPRGASVEDVKLMRGSVGDKAKIKAAGGIRDLETAMLMLEAGADRIGTSSGIEIVQAAARAR